MRSNRHLFIQGVQETTCVGLVHEFSYFIWCEESSFCCLLSRKCAQKQLGI